MAEGNNYSLADIASLMRNNDGFLEGNGIIILMLFFLLFGFGGNGFGFGNNGYAYLSVFTSRFSIDDIISKVLIIHDMPDDFTTQPSGNAGTKIACGKIMRFK